jgi:hypothetical protein
MNDFHDWFESEYGPRGNERTDDDLHYIESEGRTAMDELQRRRRWDSCYTHAREAWIAAKKSFPQPAASMATKKAK